MSRRASAIRREPVETSPAAVKSLEVPARSRSPFARLSVLVAGFLLTLQGATAQIVCALGPGPSTYNPGADQRPTPDAMELAGRVNAAVKTICAANCPVIVLFRNSTAANAMLIVNAGEAKLVYAPQFFTAAYDNYGDGGIIGMIAHELGHALDDTMGAAWINNNWSPELRADAWAGCTLARAGLAPEELEATFGALAKYPSSAHPSWNLRLPVLRTGYTQCGGNGSKFGVPARNK
jgi:hypothetical protein